MDPNFVQGGPGVTGRNFRFRAGRRSSQSFFRVGAGRGGSHFSEWAPGVEERRRLRVGVGIPFCAPSLVHSGTSLDSGGGGGCNGGAGGAYGGNGGCGEGGVRARGADGVKDQSDFHEMLPQHIGFLNRKSSVPAARVHLHHQSRAGFICCRCVGPAAQPLKLKPSFPSCF